MTQIPPHIAITYQPKVTYKRRPMTTLDITTPHRATDDDWRCVEDGAKAGSRTHRCIRTIYDLLSLTREALAALEQRVGALEEFTTTSPADVADAFEQAAQQLAPAAAPVPEPTLQDEARSALDRIEAGDVSYGADDRDPLWRVMAGAWSARVIVGRPDAERLAIAAEIRALQREVLPDEPEVILPEYPDTIQAAAWGAWKARARIRALLLAEAERAESRNPEL